MFNNISNEQKLSMALTSLLSKLDNGELLKEEISKTLLLHENDNLYHKYINAEIDSIMNPKQELIPYVKHDEIVNIGEGTYGNVYKVKHKLDDSYYAIKKVPIIIDEYNDPIKVLNEVKILAVMSYHPNIVRYYHSWLDKDGNSITCNNKSITYESSGESFDDVTPSAYLYIQMELCHGTLREYMSTQIYDDGVERRLELWQGIVNGVKHLHDYNIIHRDIKPSNIFLKNGIIKLGDFGLSRLYDNEQSYSKKSIEVGCSYYRALEIDSGIYNSSIDIYSLGIILIELLLNYNTMSEKDKVVRLMLKTGYIPKLLTDDYNGLIRRMISNKPELRPSVYELKK